MASGVIQAFNELRLEKSSADGYFILILGYARSPVRNFEKHLTIVLGVNKMVFS